ncbi:hypothetical protein ABEX47_05080 [Paenibacillus ehimensis]|uniref:hypothetical protein n=1 Tax=Paenibacillus ehimensis TaxID=79264 RepID=UPI0013E37E01|nr:hypothetical protein [Paenibacillus ehimensis]MEC0213341.1 hypothetical protein [Paenibacillus ehimensis]
MTASNNKKATNSSKNFIKNNRNSYVKIDTELISKAVADALQKQQEQKQEKDNDE